MIMESNQKGPSGGQPLDRSGVGEAKQGGAPTSVAAITATRLTTLASQGTRAMAGSTPLAPSALAPSGC